MNKIQVRQGNSDRPAVEFYDGFEIVADDGRALFRLRLLDDGTLEVESGGMHVTHRGRKLSPELALRARGSNAVCISRDEYGQQS